MIEGDIRKITDLEYGEALKDTQRVLTEVTSGIECPYSNWQQDNNKKIQDPTNFELLQIPDGYHVGPFGLVKNAE